ncbi:MAG: universal stress protein [Nocardioides sp.]
MTDQAQTEGNHADAPQSPITKDRIVAAADGTPAGIRGARFAAHEAKRLGCGLEVVHVVPRYLPLGPFPVLLDDSADRFGREVLDQASAAAREAEPELEVGTTLTAGGRVDSIVERGHEAALVVLGAHQLTLSERIWSGATVPGVAARAGCPVLVVPADYDAKRPRGRIVVGVKAPHRSTSLLESAFAMAGQSGSELTVLHAWKFPQAYDDILSTQPAREEWQAQQEAAIEEVLSATGLRDRYPEVPLTVRITHGVAALVLIAESREADRLLITRPLHGGYFHHLGSTARAVLREAHCPVEVFPPVRERATDRAGEWDLGLARDGVLQP